MATFLEAFGVLQNFSIIFTFLFIFALMYGILTYIKFLGGHKEWNAILAFSIAILFSFSKTLVKTFEYAAPWFVLVIIIITVLVLMFRFLGASETDITHVLKTKGTVVAVIFAFVFIIIILSYGQVYTESPDKNMSSFPAKVGGMLQNPKLLGIIAIFLIATYAVRYLSEKSN